MKKIIYSALSIVVLLVLIACTQTGVDASSIVAPDSIYLNVGSETTIEASIIPTDATNHALAFEIDNELVATVNQDGVITGVLVGEATLTIRSVSTPSVSKNVDIYVVDRDWPNEEIHAFSGFNLPSFPDFTAVEVDEDDDHLILLVKGTNPVNVNDAILSYRDALIAVGWEVLDGFDTHMGTFIHENYDYYIVMHNNYPHNGDSIEFKIIHQDDEDDHDHADETWADAQHAAQALFEIDLPTLENVIDVHAHQHDGELEIHVKVENRHQTLEAFLDLLITDGWIATEDSNDHLGIYVKGDVEIHYHESHDDDSLIEIVISVDGHAHDHNDED